jgi:hypothetical protein
VARVRRLLDTEDHRRLISREFVDELVPCKGSEIALLVCRDKCRRQGQARSLCGADGCVGLLLELSSLSIRGELADMSVVDLVGRELGLEPTCVGERIAGTPHATSLTDVEEDIHTRGFQLREELLRLKAIGPDGEYAADQLWTTCA